MRQVLDNMWRGHAKNLSGFMVKSEVTYERDML